MLVCKVCGGTLQMNSDLTSAVCSGCGVYYPMAALKYMQGGSSAPQPAAPVQPARPVQAAAPVQPVRSAQVAAPVQPVRSVQAAAGPMLQNERYGLAPSEYRQFKTTGSLYAVVPAKPAPLPLFASSAVRAEHERKSNAWQAAMHRLNLQRQACEKESAARKEYFRKFYEPVYPRYGREEWTPYFENILRERFPGYELKKEVPANALVHNTNSQIPADFVLCENGVPKLAVFLSGSRKRARPQACAACIKGGLPALTFFMHLSNRRDYVIQRVEKALQP